MKLEWDFSELYEFAERLDNTAKFESYCKKTTQEIAKLLRKWIIDETPKVTGELVKGWDGDNLAYVVEQQATGFKVTLMNKVPYAKAVNDGHRVRNRKRGPYYKVHTRVKVPVSYTWQLDDSEWFVYGHFFVERAIVELAATDKLEKILYRELNKWFAWCVNGK